MSEEKVVVVAKDGSASIEVLKGGAYHELNDRSAVTFNTDSLEDLSSYIAKKREDCNVIMYYSVNSVDVFFWGENSCADRFTLPNAVCFLDLSSQVCDLKRTLNEYKSISDIVEFLTIYKKTIDLGGITLLNLAKDFKMQKTTDVTRQKLENGDFSYIVTRKSGKDSMVLPELVCFTVPLFKHNTGIAIDIPCVPMFSYSEAADGVSCNFKLQCYGLDDLINCACREKIKSSLKDFGDCEMYWGKRTITIRDDSWKYMSK